MGNNGHPQSFPQALKGLDTPALPGDFDFHFRLLVIPILHRGAARLAPFVARGDIGFGEALDALSALAVKRGGDRVADLDGLLECLAIYLADRVEAQP